MINKEKQKIVTTAPSIVPCEKGMLMVPGLGSEWGLDVDFEESQNNKHYLYFLLSSSATHHYKLIAPFLLLYFQTFSLLSPLFQESSIS